MKITATRYHDISCGHRVVGHEGKCQLLHGHNYRVHFTCQADALDPIGRVMDFGVIKARLCGWLETVWDHRFLAWQQDHIMHSIEKQIFPHESEANEVNLMLQNSIVWVPFNPTAENMADYLLNVIGPKRLDGTGVTLIRVTIDETRKCSATAERS